MLRKLFFPVFLLTSSSWSMGSDGLASKPLEEVVVTATRFSQPVDKLPIGVSIITAEQIKNSAAITLPELLQQVAGIHTRNVDGSPDPQIDMRGFGITGNQNTLVLLDGQRMNENELVGIRFSTIPLDSIERIEVPLAAWSILLPALPLLERWPAMAVFPLAATVGLKSRARWMWRVRTSALL
jgi:iron complex outermembrane receptor protein